MNNHHIHTFVNVGHRLTFNHQTRDQALDKIKKTIIVLNDKLIKFLTNIYLGPLFESTQTPSESTQTPFEPIQTFLKFLDPNDPYCGVTSNVMLPRILNIYQKSNDLMMTTSSNCKQGGRPATEIKEYFSEEYNTIISELVDHQEKYGEVVGDYMQYSPRGKPTRKHGMHVSPNDTTKKEFGKYPESTARIWLVRLK